MLKAKQKRPQKPRHRSSPAKDKPLVVLIHGLSVPRQVMWRLQRLLENEYGRQTLNVGYNSLLQDIPDIATKVAREVKELGIKEFDAITHSMGAVVLRWAMNNHSMPRLRRAVLITPPNQGAWIASRFHEKLGAIFPLVWGQAAMQLRPDDLGIAANAGLLEGTETGVIAAGTGTAKGARNWFGIPGDNDGLIAVEETILPGMQDFLLVKNNHTSVIFSSQTAHMCNLFLDHGVFRPKMKELEAE